MSRTPKFESLSPWAAGAAGRAEPLGRHEPVVGRTTRTPTTKARLSKAVDTEGSLPAHYDKGTVEAFLKGRRDPTGIGSRGFDVPWSSIGDITDALGRGKWPDSGDMFDWLESIGNRFGGGWMEDYFGGPPKGDGLAMQTKPAETGLMEEIAKAIRDAMAKTEKAMKDFRDWVVDEVASAAAKDTIRKVIEEELGPTPKINWDEQKLTSGRHIELIKWGNEQLGQAGLAKAWKSVRKGGVPLEALDTSRRQQMAQLLQHQWTASAPVHSDVGSQDVFRVKMKVLNKGGNAMQPDRVQRLFGFGKIDPRP